MAEFYRQPYERLVVFSYHFVDTNNYYCMWLTLLNLKLAWRSLTAPPLQKQSFDYRFFQLKTQKWGYCQTWSRYTVFASWLVSSSVSLPESWPIYRHIHCWPLKPLWSWVKKGLLLHVVWPTFLPWHPFCCTIRKWYYNSVTYVNYSASFTFIVK